MSVQSLHFAAPTIEVVSESPRLEMLQARLKQAGLRPVRAAVDIDPALATPILIDLAVVNAHDQHVIISACKRHGSRPIIMLGEGQQRDRDFIRLMSPEQISSLSARLDLRQRQITQNREAELRHETIERLTNVPANASIATTAQAIYYGPQSPRFVSLRNQLADEGITLRGALTPHTLTAACDAQEIHAILINASYEDDAFRRALSDIESTSISKGIAKIILATPSQDIYFAKSADYVIDIDTTDDIAAHIYKTARNRAVQTPANPMIKDSATGLYSKAFLEAHLGVQLRSADQTGQPLTMIGIELNNHLRGTKSTAERILAELRATDLAARYSARHIVVSLPATAYGGAIQIARRLQTECEVISDITVLERRQFHTPQSLLAGLLGRSDIAATRRA
ncbi:MAG: hypothetical protein AAGK66_07740 [Pseudomonadota bacterium]